MSNAKKPVLVFEAQLPAKDIRRLERAGYAVVCTVVPFKVLGPGNVTAITRSAFEFLANCAHSSAKRDFGEVLIQMLLKEIKEE